MLIAVAGVWSWAQFRRANQFRAKTFRIGVDHNPPNHDWSEQKGATGFDVDVLNDAARRAGVKLDWVFVPRWSSAVLLDGSIDLWPVGYYRPGEIPGVHQTRPWNEIQHAWIWDRGRMPVGPERLDRKRVAVVDRQVTRDLVLRTFPNIDILSTPSRLESVNAMCAGRADLAFLNSRVLEEALLNRPANCRTTMFQVQSLPDLIAPMSIFSRMDSAGVAEVLRDRIDEMLVDGTVVGFAEKWFSLSSSEVRQASRLKARTLELKWLAALCVVMALAIGLLFWLIRNLRLARAGRTAPGSCRASFWPM